MKICEGRVAIVTGAGGGLGRQHALALAAAVQTVTPGLPPETQAAWLSYASLVDEIARLASAKGTIAPAGWRAPVLSRKQLQDFGRLLRDCYRAS